VKKGLVAAVLLALACAPSQNLPQVKPEVVPEEQESSVRYSPLVMNNFYFLYRDKINEFPVCMLGEETQDSIYVNGLRIPHIINSTEHSARFNLVSCHEDPRYLGVIHSHNNGFCGLSEADEGHFVRDTLARIETIVCDLTVENGDQYVRLFTAIKKR